MGIPGWKINDCSFAGHVSQLVEFLENGKEVEAIFFDFKKAFDTVPHDILFNKLEEVHLDPILIRWIRSYLTDRMQQVVVNGAASNALPVLSVVPQGSVLGPLLFLIYIDGVNNVTLSPGSNLVVYADDMLLYRPISSLDDYTYICRLIDAIA